MSPPVHKIKDKKFRVPTTPPPFTKRDLKNAIPKHCFERSTFKSSMYLVADLIGVTLLYYFSTLIPEYPSFFAIILWPTYWVLQGGVCTGLWVIAHECGHRAFSDSVFVCDVVGWILHSLLTVPYHSWRISHGKHHRSTGNIDKDEVFLPKKLSTLKNDVAKAYRKPNSIATMIQLIGMFLVGWYVYLLSHVAGRDYGEHTDHYNPKSPLFNERQFWPVVISDVGVAFTFIGLAYWTYQTSFTNVLCIYGVPLLIVNFWLLLYTYLHHTDPAIPHYSDDSWNWLQGALTTIDRDYGIFWNTLHHDIGNTHVLHHLFSHIPHYHAKEASEAIKPILGEYYYHNPKSIISCLWEAAIHCNYVDDSASKKVLWYVEPK